MIIKPIPQQSDNKLHVVVDIVAETVTASLDGIEDTFDFSAFEDGKADRIETILPVNPIVQARRDNGELYLELLHWYQDPDTPEEVRHPVPQQYTEGVIVLG